MKKAIIIINTILTVITLSLSNSIEAESEIKILQPVPILDEIKMEDTMKEVVEEEETEDTTLAFEKYRYINCPLSEELQQGILDICKVNNISFEFVMAVIMQESSFRPSVTGDNGSSKGLMQIQEKWHSETMKEVGVTDLYDPLGNVEVGVAILVDYFEELGDVYHVLMRYNGGEPYATNMMKAGKVSDYAKEITERAIQYEEENGI